MSKWIMRAHVDGNTVEHQWDNYGAAIEDAWDVVKGGILSTNRSGTICIYPAHSIIRVDLIEVK